MSVKVPGQVQYIHFNASSISLIRSPHVCADEILCKATDANVEALQNIVSAHFRAGCLDRVPMNEGSYARVFLFTLQDDRKVVAKVLLPVRETVKTEGEVAAMELVRGITFVPHQHSPQKLPFLARTRIPVPEVYLYCSTPHNPVGAEWILMEYLPGRRLGDYYDNITPEQMLRVGTDLAHIMSSLFKITASQCGSLSSMQSSRSFTCLDSSTFRYRSLRDPTQDSGDLLRLPASSRIPVSVDEPHCVGPINDLAFLNYPRQIIPAQFCGPFDSEREFMKAFAFLGQPPTRKALVPRYLHPFEITLQIYDIVIALYRQSESSKLRPSSETFHFAHGDFSGCNVLIDPETGAVTGVIDWEMAGFRPAWLAAVAAAWFDDDYERFLMSDHQDERGNYAEETPADAVARAQFRLTLAALDHDLFHHYFQGPELRALFYACCNESAGNTEVYLQKYMENEWHTGRRGPFPVDLWAWIRERCNLDRLFVSPIFSPRDGANAYCQRVACCAGQPSSLHTVPTGPRPLASPVFISPNCPLLICCGLRAETMTSVYNR
jgi:serine/threonine protein kinase